MSVPENRTMEKPTQERRNVARHRALKRAQIVFKHEAVIDCTVRNLSDGGACLNVECSIGIPDSFDSSAAAWLGAKLRKSGLSSSKRFFRLHLDRALFDTEIESRIRFSDTG
jgi:hypothetical protein